MRRRRRRAPSRARAWPADSTPAATRRCTGGGSLSSRRVLQICGRERPMRVGELVVRAAEVVEQLLVGRSLLSGLSWARCRFSSRASRSRSSSSVSRTMAGIGRQAGGLRRPPAPLAHDQLVAVPGRRRPHDDRLQQADLADRVRRARPARPRRRPCGAGAGSGVIERRGSSAKCAPATGSTVAPRCAAAAARPRRVGGVAVGDQHVRPASGARTPVVLAGRRRDQRRPGPVAQSTLLRRLTRPSLAGARQPSTRRTRCADGSSSQARSCALLPSLRGPRRPDGQLARGLEVGQGAR